MEVKFISKKDWLTLKRAIVYMKPYKLKFAISLISMLLNIGIGIMQPLLWGKLLTNLFEKKFNGVILNIAYILILFLINTLVQFYQNYLFSSLSQNIIFDIKNQMFRKILDLPVKAFDEIGTGEFLSRLNNDAVVIANIITNHLLNVVLNVLKVVFIGIVIFRISIPLALIVIAAFPVSSTIFLLFGKRLREKNNDLAILNDKYFRKTVEYILGIREIKCLGIKKATFATYFDLSKTIKEKNINIGILNSLSDTAAASSNFIAYYAVVAVGGFFVFKGRLIMEQFIAFTLYSEQFSNSLINVTRLNYSIQQALTSLERIFGLLDNFSYSNDKFGNENISNITGSIKFENINFEYNVGNSILKKITFHIEENKKVAFVGTSGGGKTTIFNLLLRFYEPSSGNITIGGIDIKDYTENSLRSHISIVRQDPVLFNTTIKENLLLANPMASDEEIYQACKKSYLHDYIMGLSQQYDTVIEENGVNFSGGQKQRIAIARAILKNSKIILFDEATSSLDNESQYYIKNAIDELSHNHTFIIIAHRLLTVIDADEIFVIDNGEIIGNGNHEALIMNNEKYKSLYKKELDILYEKHQEVK